MRMQFVIILSLLATIMIVISGCVNMSENYQKPSDEELSVTLTPLQCEVTQRNGTEPPFNNEYWNNKEDGIIA